MTDPTESKASEMVPVAWNCVYPTHGHFTLKRHESEQAATDGAKVTPLYAIPDAFLQRVRAMETALRRLVTTYDKFEDGNGDPCPDVAFARSLLPNMEDKADE